MTKIAQALTRLFEKHRIVFWYDAKKELRSEYEALVLEGVEKIEILHNEFGLKHRLLRQQSQQKFLLYHHGPQPPDLENWLLDVLLSHGVFRADQLSLWLSDLGLGPEYWELVQQHEGFFQSEARRQALKFLLVIGDSFDALRLKMLAVCAGSAVSLPLDALLEILLDQLAEEKTEIIALIQHSALDEFLWQRLERLFGYTSQHPSLRDFAIALFKASYELGLGQSAAMGPEALVFLNRWKDSRRHHAAFEKLSQQCEAILNIEADLQNRSLEVLIPLDIFRLIDLKIITALVEQVHQRTLSLSACAQLIWQRRTTHWFNEFSHIYDAISAAAAFLAELDQAELIVQSIEDGLRKYSLTWFRLDQFYRKFIYHAHASQQVSVLQRLDELVENKYSNNYLRTLADQWQPIIDRLERWDFESDRSQRRFYATYVDEYVRSQKKVAVIISDALRYEVASELAERIRSEDRYTAELHPMLGVLPSYTQLGMAALLPHESMLLLNDSSVMVDAHSASGSQNRLQILDRAVPGVAAVLSAEELSSMSREDSRALFRDNQVIYVYHNQIDAVGDKRDTEEHTFEAVEQALQEIVNLVKKLANANLTNILVTADHGFIYQNRELDESEFASQEITGEEILYRTRRFVFGKELHPNPSARIFWCADLGVHGEVQIALAKSILRLRQQGTGSRYVHGGASLQEIILPVVHINKKRESDIRQVGVDILRSPSSVISTGQFSVVFFQEQPVTSKVQARRLRAGLYTQSGELISNTHDLNFDFTSENPRERDVTVRFILSHNAGQANGQDVFLKLEELVPDTAHYQEYKATRYLLRRSFTSDFD